MQKILFGVLILLCNQSIAQKELTPELLEQYAYKFTISEQNTLSDSAQVKWKNWIGENQFIGLAEKHNSTQLSIFTTALLPILKERGFEYFALELGPNSATILNEYAEKSDDIGEDIKSLNTEYGKNNVSETPVIFVNKKKDALFMNMADKLGFTFWGMDQEYAYAYEMLLDRVFILESDQSNSDLYTQSKKLINKNIFKDKVNGQAIYCWYQSEPTINAYLNSVHNNDEAIKIVADMRESWDIYCKSVSGIWSGQQRGDYMKSNFDTYYKMSGDKPKVFLKMGNAHLTHNISPFQVDDLGKHLTEKAVSNQTGFLNIRHFNPYINGKNYSKESSVSVLQSIGNENEWTVIDLRPIRELLKKGEIVADEKYTYELLNYDLLLLSPNDKRDKANY